MLIELRATVFFDWAQYRLRRPSGCIGCPIIGAGCLTTAQNRFPVNLSQTSSR